MFVWLCEHVSNEFEHIMYLTYFSSQIMQDQMYEFFIISLITSLSLIGSPTPITLTNAFSLILFH